MRTPDYSTSHCGTRPNSCSWNFLQVFVLAVTVTYLPRSHLQTCSCKSPECLHLSQNSPLLLVWISPWSACRLFSSIKQTILTSSFAPPGGSASTPSNVHYHNLQMCRKGTIITSSPPSPADLRSLFPSCLFQVIIIPNSNQDPFFPLRGSYQTSTL